MVARRHQNLPSRELPRARRSARFQLPSSMARFGQKALRNLRFTRGPLAAPYRRRTVGSMPIESLSAIDDRSKRSRALWRAPTRLCCGLGSIRRHGQGDLRQARIGLAVLGKAVDEHRDPVHPAIPFADEHCARPHLTGRWFNSTARLPLGVLPSNGTNTVRPTSRPLPITAIGPNDSHPPDVFRCPP
jgi:hypothetical protein